MDRNLSRDIILMLGAIVAIVAVGSFFAAPLMATTESEISDRTTVTYEVASATMGEDGWSVAYLDDGTVSVASFATDEIEVIDAEGEASLDLVTYTRTDTTTTPDNLLMWFGKMIFVWTISEPYEADESVEVFEGVHGDEISVLRIDASEIK